MTGTYRILVFVSLRFFVSSSLHLETLKRTKDKNPVGVSMKEKGE